MEISKYRGLFGFQPYEFRSLLKGDTLVLGYSYKNKKIKELLIEGSEDYVYEDEDVIFHSPTEIVDDGIFSFIIKKKFLIYENENFYFYTNFDLDNSEEELNVIMIQAILKNNDNTYFTWIYATIDYTIKTLQTISKEKFYEYYPTELAFYLTGYYGFKKIDRNNLLTKLMTIVEENDLPSNAITGELFL
jgi:uncharacterized protein YsxB (DUF464 family)